MKSVVFVQLVEKEKLFFSTRVQIKPMSPRILAAISLL